MRWPTNSQRGACTWSSPPVAPTPPKRPPAALRQSGGTADGLELDVNDSTSIAAAARTFAERFGRLDVLINNAGVYPDEGLTILTIPRQQLVQTLETNTFGPIVVVQAFLPCCANRIGAA